MVANNNSMQIDSVKLGWDDNLIQCNPRKPVPCRGTEYDPVFNSRQATFENVFKFLTSVKKPNKAGVPCWGTACPGAFAGVASNVASAIVVWLSKAVQLRPEKAVVQIDLLRFDAIPLCSGTAPEPPARQHRVIARNPRQIKDPGLGFDRWSVGSDSGITHI